jgi:hypothetical protein
MVDASPETKTHDTSSWWGHRIPYSTRIASAGCTASPRRAGPTVATLAAISVRLLRIRPCVDGWIPGISRFSKAPLVPWTSPGGVGSSNLRTPLLSKIDIG